MGRKGLESSCACHSAWRMERKDPTLSQSEPGDVVGWVMGTIIEADKRIRNFPAVWKPLVWREEPGGEGW